MVCYISLMNASLIAFAILFFSPFEKRDVLWIALLPRFRQENEVSGHLLTDSPPINHIHRIVSLRARWAQKGLL